MTLKPILIIGGTGVFGKRLVRHLASWDGIAVYVSSRSAAKATAFINSIEAPKAPLHAVALDCQRNLQDRLAEIQPLAVVDCSGPFQGASYDTARTIIASGAHLVDLADARGYIAGFADALHALACNHKVAALTGASSTPALSTCVVNGLTCGWSRVDTIDISITPGGRSEVGRSVIEAILSYAGHPVPAWREGQLTTTTGWRDARIIEIPGLGHRRVTAVETYDAEYLGPMLDVQSRVSFSAGLESRVEQWGIEAIALLRRFGVIGRLNWLIPLLLKARRITRIPTSASGAMLVSVEGVDGDGRAQKVDWSLIAHNDHGPYIPILPAAAVLAKLCEGPPPAAGAAIAHEVLDLDAIVAEMRPYDIATSVR